MRHTDSDLAQMQSLPLKYKIIMTKQRIRAWYEAWDGLVYVSFSGGKVNGGEEVNGIWQPNKRGLGLGKVLDYIGVKY